MNITKDLTYEDEQSIGYRYNLIILDKRMAYLNIIYNCNNNESIITDFTSIETNKGYGSIILDYVIIETKKLKIKVIFLDDMSDRYRNLHNVYKKFGFNYLYDFGPEMKLILDS